MLPGRLPGDHRVRIGDVDLRYDDRGRGEPALVLVHGYTGSTEDWAAVAPRLAERRRVLAYDHRGHGGSAHVGRPGGYALDLLLADLRGLLDHLGLTSVDLVGHSMGGVVALRFALDAPARVRSLVLMDTAAEPAVRLPLGAIEALAAIGRARGMAAAYRIAAVRLGVGGNGRGGDEGRPAGAGRDGSPGDHGAGVGDGRGERDRRRRARQAAEAGGRPAHAGAGRDGSRGDGSAGVGDERGAGGPGRVAPSLARVDPEALVELGRDLTGYPTLVDRLDEVACPTTVIVGEHDHGLRAAAEVLATGIPDADLAVIPGAGHSPQVDRPEAWLAVVEAHLARFG